MRATVAVLSNVLITLLLAVFLVPFILLEDRDNIALTFGKSDFC
jgi:hypothetical protein